MPRNTRHGSGGACRNPIRALDDFECRWGSGSGCAIHSYVPTLIIFLEPWVHATVYRPEVRNAPVSHGYSKQDVVDEDARRGCQFRASAENTSRLWRYHARAVGKVGKWEWSAPSARSCQASALQWRIILKPLSHWCLVITRGTLVEARQPNLWFARVGHKLHPPIMLTCARAPI